MLMEVDDQCNPKSLKSCCMCVIRKNDWLRDNRYHLAFLPANLLYDLCNYVSPFGLYLLEQLPSFLRWNIDHLYLTQWTFPSSYTLKARIRCREMISSLHSSITDKQFFYDSILNEVIEQLMYAHSIDKSLEQAWHHFTQYPMNHGCSDGELVCFNNAEFMNILASHTTSLTINLSVAHGILENDYIFSPILHAITYINLNLQIKSRQHQNIGKIVEIIKIARQYNLSSVSIKLNKESVLNCYEYFKQVTTALYCPIENSNCAIYSREMEIKQDIDYLDDIYIEDTDENLSNDEYKVSTTEECGDLFDYVFEHTNNLENGNYPKLIVDTNIVEFELSAYENEFYCIFLDYISQWRTLQKLSIHGYNFMDEVKMKDVFTALANYNNLKELTLSDFWLPDPELHVRCCSENALIQLAKPSCRIHEINKSLKTLRLHNCDYHDGFLSSILCHEPSQFCVNSTDQCIVDGLISLEITLLRDSDQLSSYLMKNTSLKELIIYKSHYDVADNNLLDVVSGMKLRIFSFTSKFKCHSPPTQSLQELLQNINLNHLELHQICHDDYIFHGYAEIWGSVVSSLKLTTLVWTKNGMGNKGLVDFTGYLSCLQYLKVLDISGNLFNIDGVTIFLQTLHNHRRYLDKLSLGSPNVRYSDIKKSGLEWIIKEHVNLFLGSYIEMDASDHIAQM